MSARRSTVKSAGGEAVEPARVADIARQLLAWFDRGRRDMPWRRSRDPYAIWVSEIMLQQTRVETVIPYFERFIARFPDVDTLAQVPIDDVLSAWSGLGYYRRARGLHAAAREIVLRYGAKLPSAVEDLKSLPGIGDYTAGAIASIAYDVRAAAIDGNVTRVLARHLGLEGDATSTPARKAIRAACEALVPARRPGDFNQALMELGATVCTPGAPRCDACPIASSCRGRALGVARELGSSKPKRASPTVKLVAAIATRRDTVLLGRRPLDGLFGGLWEPPLATGSSRVARSTFEAAGIEIVGPIAREPVVHVLTHRVLEVRVASARAAPGVSLEPYTELAYVKRRGVADLPLSTLARRLLRVSFGDV